MKTIFVRPAHPGDADKATSWTVQNMDRNRIDPNVLTYRSTFVLAAYRQGGPIMFMPIQTPFMMESVAFDPSLSKMEQAAALKELTQALITDAHLKGVGEIYFVDSDPETSQFAANHIFERIDKPVYRVKIADLEK